MTASWLGGGRRWRGRLIGGRLTPARLVAALAMLGVVLGACAPDRAPAQLVVLVSGLPSGVTAEVTVAGADLSQKLTDGAVLEVTPGTYTVTVGPAIGSEPIARTVYDGTPSASLVDVRASATVTVDVAYARRPGTGRAWIAGEDAVHAYDVSAWEASGAATPASWLSLPEGFGNPLGFAASPHGDLFVALSGFMAPNGAGVARYAVSDLDTPGAAAAGVVPLPTTTTRVAWHDGRLYAMGHGHPVVYRFDDPDAIVGDAVTTPDAAMTVAGGYEIGGSAAGLAFDALGRLWIPLYQAMVRIDAPGAPEGTVDVVPDAALESVFGVVIGFLYRDDALYLGHFESDRVLRFDGVDATAGVTQVTPSAIVAVDGFHVEVITVDASDRFWLATFDPQRVARYPDLSALADGSSVPPIVAITHAHRSPFSFLATRLE
jgi:hypothetical protein